MRLGVNILNQPMGIASYRDSPPKNAIAIPICARDDPSADEETATWFPTQRRYVRGSSRGRSAKPNVVSTAASSSYKTMGDSSRPEAQLSQNHLGRAARNDGGLGGTENGRHTPAPLGIGVRSNGRTICVGCIARRQGFQRHVRPGKARSTPRR